MKKRLFLSLAAVLTTVALGVGASFALFSDNVSSANTVTAGTLCLESERNDGDTVPGPMFYVTAAQGQTPPPLNLPGMLPTGLWAPGDTHTRTLTVFNRAPCSSMNAWLTSVQAELDPATDYPAMTDELYVEVWTPQGGGPDVKVAEGYLTQFLTGAVPLVYPDTTQVPLYFTSNRHMKFMVKFDLDADNQYQGKTVVVHFKVNGVQMANNP